MKVSACEPIKELLFSCIEKYILASGIDTWKYLFLEKKRSEFL
ncbi:hypothetical protein [Bacillus sp. CH30_1T]|nr:hypothetical protein [Bacillus sp. CH30_1T]